MNHLCLLTLSRTETISPQFARFFLRGALVATTLAAIQLVFPSRAMGQISKHEEWLGAVKLNAEQGDPDSMGILADLMMDGWVYGDRDTIEKLAGASKEAGSAFGKYAHGCTQVVFTTNVSLGNQLISESRQTISDLAEQGHGYANVVMGYLSQGQGGVQQDIPAALSYFEKAADAIPIAQFLLAVLNGGAAGSGSEQAAKWRQLAASNGIIPCKHITTGLLGAEDNIAYLISLIETRDPSGWAIIYSAAKKESLSDSSNTFDSKPIAVAFWDLRKKIATRDPVIKHLSLNGWDTGAFNLLQRPGVAISSFPLQNHDLLIANALPKSLRGGLDTYNVLPNDLDSLLENLPKFYEWSNKARELKPEPFEKELPSGALFAWNGNSSGIGLKKYTLSEQEVITVDRLLGQFSEEAKPQIKNFLLNSLSEQNKKQQVIEENFN